MEIEILNSIEGAYAAQGLTVVMDIFGDITAACLRAATEVATLTPEAAGYIREIAGDGEVILGGLVNAKAVATYIREKKPEKVTFLNMGSQGAKNTAEYAMCAKYIAGLAEHNPLRNVSHMIAQLKYTDGAQLFQENAAEFWARTACDQLDFVLVAQRGSTALQRLDITYKDEPIVYTKVKPGDMLSQFTRQEVLDLPWEIKGAISYGCYCEPEGNFDATVLLGGNPTVMESRSAAAAKLYHTGRCDLFIPTGGVKWETEFGYLSECDVMAHYMIKMGVPKEKIRCEAQATTTRTNMEFVRDLLAERMDIGKARIAFATSYYHIRRSLLLAKYYIPQAQHFGIRAEFPGDDPAQFQNDPRLLAAVSMECLCMWKNISQGMSEDIQVL